MALISVCSKKFDNFGSPGGGAKIELPIIVGKSMVSLAGTEEKRRSKKLICCNDIVLLFYLRITGLYGFD